MLLELELSDLAWVIDYVAEDEPASLQSDDDDCVVRAARRLIDQLNEQFEPEEIARIDAHLEKVRRIRWPVNWTGPRRDAVAV